MKTYLIVPIILFSALSCQNKEIKNFRLEGDLTAKKVIVAKCDLPGQVQTSEYRWYLAPSPDSGWEKIEGIRTDEIVLLTSYVDQYLKCEVTAKLKNDREITASVVSSQPVGFKGNPNTDWFRDAGFGIMVHFLKEVFAPEGGSEEWNEVVNGFNVAKFAEQAKEAGAGFVMFTLGQNSGYYCAPNSAFDSVTGAEPGDLCSLRDLPLDLMKELNKHKIPLILYLPSNPPVNNRLVSDKFHYPYKKDSATSQFNQPILENMIREWSLRYGEGVKGWWFDGLYSWNAIRSTRMDMSLKHNISTHTLAAKAGNKNSIVTYNSGFGKIKANTPYCDYTSGEKSTIDEVPAGRWVEDGVQWFLFTYLGEKWGGKGRQFETDSLTAKAEKIVKNEGVLCLEVVPTATGEILPHQLEQIKAVGIKLGKIKQ